MILRRFVRGTRKGIRFLVFKACRSEWRKFPPLLAFRMARHGVEQQVSSRIKVTPALDSRPATSSFRSWPVRSGTISYKHIQFFPDARVGQTGRRLMRVHAPPGFIISSVLGASPGLPDLAAWSVPCPRERGRSSAASGIITGRQAKPRMLSPCPLQDPYIPRF